jgi:hypothetical protein
MGDSNPRCRYDRPVIQLFGVCTPVVANPVREDTFAESVVPGIEIATEPLK